jgi:hypothetical protein
VGVARSGTTLLRLMLDAHPQLAIPAETGFLPAVSGLAGGGDALRRAFFDALTTLPTWEDLALDRDAFREALGRVEPFSVADGLRCFYRAYAAGHGKRRRQDAAARQHLLAIQARCRRPASSTSSATGATWPCRCAVVVRAETPRGPGPALAEHCGDARAGPRLPALPRGALRRPADRHAAVLRRVSFLELPFSLTMEEYHRHARRRLDEVRTRNADGSVLISKEQRLHLHRLTQRGGRWAHRPVEVEMPQEGGRSSSGSRGPPAELGYETAA